MHSDMQDMDDYRGPELMAERREIPRRFSRGRVWVAAIALTAFVGFSWYAYRQATKVGEEGVAPLIAADQGPTRVKPEEPGGMDVPHQDKSVYDRMGNEEQASTKVESLLPGPEAPMPHPAATASTTPSVSSTVASTTTDTNTPSGAPPAAASTQTAAVPPPPPPPSMAETKAAAGVSPAAGTPAHAETSIKPPAPAASAETKTAPAEAKTAAVEPPPPSAAASASSTSSAAATGNYRIQLGSLRSEEAADGQWKKLQKSFPDLLSSLSPKIEKVDLAGKGTFYRLQAGAMSESAAKELCEKLKQHKAECIVVKS